jgi:epimerase EvaD
MQARELAVEGAFEFTPQVVRDANGLLVTQYQHDDCGPATGYGIFTVRQTVHNRLRRGAVRGVHFTRTPPGGSAKYVYCPAGQVLDIVVDLRVGSPTFGRWDAVLIDEERFRSVYLPVGVGHAFVALCDDAVMSYLLPERVDRTAEAELSVFDPDLKLPIPADIEPILSERDRQAPSLAELIAAGTLPSYATCRELEAGFMLAEARRPRAPRIAAGKPPFGLL